MKNTRFRFICLWITTLALAFSMIGCGTQPSGSTESTAASDPSTQDSSTISQEPEVFTMDQVLHFSYMPTLEAAEATFDAQVKATVCDYAEQEDTIELYMDLPEECADTFDHSAVSFTVTHEDQRLPYYCAHGYLYDALTDSLTPYVLAIDFEMGYMIYKINHGEEECFVGSADPDVKPEQIVEHFQKFMELSVFEGVGPSNLEHDRIEFQGSRISEDGRFIGDCTLQWEGSFIASENRKPEYRSFVITIPGYHTLWSDYSEGNTVPDLVPDDLECYYLRSTCYVTVYSTYHQVSILLDYNKQWCIVIIDAESRGREIFVGIADEALEPVAIFEEYRSYFE